MSVVSLAPAHLRVAERRRPRESLSDPFKVAQSSPVTRIDHGTPEWFPRLVHATPAQSRTHETDSAACQRQEAGSENPVRSDSGNSGRSGVTASATATTIVGANCPRGARRGMLDMLKRREIRVYSKGRTPSARGAQRSHEGSVRRVTSEPGACDADTAAERVRRREGGGVRGTYSRGVHRRTDGDRSIQGTPKGRFAHQRFGGWVEQRDDEPSLPGSRVSGGLGAAQTRANAQYGAERNALRLRSARCFPCPFHPSYFRLPTWFS